MKFKFVEKNRSLFPVKKMCLVLEISHSGYYRWRKAPLSSRKIESERLKGRIKELFAKHKGMVGSPIITADLREDPEFGKVSWNRVARYIREMGLRYRAIRKFVVTTDSKHNEPVAPNLPNSKFLWVDGFSSIPFKS
jgi:putative transposase